MSVSSHTIMLLVPLSDILAHAVSLSRPLPFPCTERGSKLFLGAEFQRRLRRNRRFLVGNRQILMLNRASIN